MSLEGAWGTKTAESREFFGVHPNLVGFGEMVLNVLFPFIAEERDDCLQLRVGRPDFFGADQVSSAARPDEEAVLLGQAAHALDRLLRIDREGRVYQPPVALEDAGHEAVRDALYSIRCSPTSPHIMVEDSEGSIAKSLTPGLTSRKACPTPTSVPPVPTPMTSASGTVPSGSCARISGPRTSRFS